MHPCNFFIISPSKSWANSIKRYIKWNIGANASNIEIPFFEEKEIPEIFNFISSELEKNSSSVLRDSIAIFDGCFWELGLNPLVAPPNRSTLAAMLALAFPEIHWIFIMMINEKNGVENNKCYYLQKLSEFFKKIDSAHFPLFDAEGFRNKLREIMKSSILKQKLKYLKIREEISAAIDEEEPYAYLHSYIAYKMGYRAFVVTTENLMNILFNKGDGKPQIKIVFEDMFLNFPDRNKEGLSDLQKRDSTNNYPLLKNVPKRIFVTVGHKYTKAYERNKIYIQILKEQGKKIKKVYKPSAGIYNLLENTNLIKDYWKNRKEEWKDAKPEIEEEGGGHSAPGRLLVIANILINRAERILHEAKSVQECIHGALLALEAQELLGYRTPTTCLEAIALKHQLEVKAECMFYGISYNIDLKNRFKEMENEIKAVSKWFHHSAKKKAELNAQMGIITEIIEILRDFGQFDEEQECLRCFRKLNRKWLYRNKPLLNIIFRPFQAYFETLASSFPLFFSAVALIPFLVGLWQYFIHKEADFSQHILQAYITFFSFQPIDSADKIPGYFPHNDPLTLLLIIGGFFHLGIFISYLYTIIMRK